MEHRAEMRLSEFDKAPREIRLGDAPATIVDVCSSGLRVHGEYKLTIGEPVDIVVADFAPIPGQVVWMRSHEVGISLPPGAFALNSSGWAQPRDAEKEKAGRVSPSGLSCFLRR